jgi:hypothetical protein
MSFCLVDAGMSVAVTELRSAKARLISQMRSEATLRFNGEGKD